MRRPLLISRDLTRTGAPVALLALVGALKRLGERPLVAALYGGPLEQRFRDAGAEFVDVDVDPRAISFVIANTAFSVPAALRFKRYGVVVAAWLHEAAYFFGIVGVSPQQYGLPTLDYVLLPAEFQARELAPYLPEGRSFQLRNLVRQEYFRPGPGDATLAVCGGWELRKGQARLLELARDVVPQCRFKFIGPERSAAHEVPRDSDIPHSFLGSLEPEAARAEIARSDGYVSCSEGEVQPLSVLEALMAGRPALLSDIPAHRAIAEQVPNVVLFDRRSRQSFALGLARLRAVVNDVAAGERSRAVSVALFGQVAFDARVAAIVRLLQAKDDSAVDVARSQDM